MWIVDKEAEQARLQASVPKWFERPAVEIPKDAHDKVVETNESKAYPAAKRKALRGPRAEGTTFSLTRGK